MLPSCLATVSWGDGRLDVFGAGIDEEIWHASWDGVWSDFESLGDSGFVSVPAAVSWGVGRLDAFGVGTDSAMWHDWWAESAGGAAWNGPGSGCIVRQVAQGRAAAEISRWGPEGIQPA
jgi:hypothetical protein